MANKDSTLDGWRGLAILCVLVSHFTGWLWLGPFGVKLFFVLSGYLMAGVLFKKKTELGTFFVRRFSRVIPAFLLFTGVMYLYAAWWQPTRYVPSLVELAATVTFMRTYFPSGLSIFNTGWPIGHFWSLNVEEHSYLFLALLAVVVRRIKRDSLVPWFLWASFAASVGFQQFYKLNPPDIASPYHLLSQCAAYGLLASAAYRMMSWRPVKGGWVALSCIAGAVFVSVPGSPFPHGTLAAPLLAIALNHLHEIPLQLRRAISWKPLVSLGLASFSLYLWQQPFAEAWQHYGLNPILCLAGAMIAGTLSYRYFEKPIRQFLNEKWDKRGAAIPLGVKTNQ